MQALESQLATLRSEKDTYANIVYGLRGCVDQTSLVLGRSKARFTRLHDQLSDTRMSLTTSQLEWDHHPQGLSSHTLYYCCDINVLIDEVMTLNELYQENEELRNTVSFIRSHLLDQQGHHHRPTRSLSPSRQHPTSLDGVSETDMLVLENKDLREKVLPNFCRSPLFRSLSSSSVSLPSLLPF